MSAGCLASVRAQAPVQHVVIAKTGDAAPAGGNYVRFNTVSLNAYGKAAFDASLRGISNSGVFFFDGATTSPVALGSSTPTPGSFFFVGSPFIDRRGDVLFSSDTAILRSDGKTIVPLVQNGDSAPGGGSLTPGFFVTDPSGVFAFYAAITGDVNSQGIFRRHGSDTQTVARLDQQPPTGGSFTFLQGFAINRHHQVAYSAVTVGGSADNVIFRKDGEATKTIFAQNQKAPGGGFFGDFSDPVINEYGQVVTEGFALTNTSSAFGIFLGDGEKVITIALDGHAAPEGGTPPTYHFVTPEPYPRLTAHFAGSPYTMMTRATEMESTRSRKRSEQNSRAFPTPSCLRDLQCTTSVSAKWIPGLTSFFGLSSISLVRARAAAQYLTQPVRFPSLFSAHK